MKKSLLFCVLILTLLLSPLVNALGVSTPYYIGHPLNAYPGQVVEFNVYIANENSEQIKVTGEILQSGEIAGFVNSMKEYIIPPNVNNYPVMIRISIPENTPIGTEYTVEADFKQVKADDSGQMITMGVGVGRYIPVVVKAKEEVPVVAPPPQEAAPKEVIVTKRTNQNPLIIAYIIIILILMILFYFWKKNKQKQIPTQQTKVETDTKKKI